MTQGGILHGGQPRPWGKEETRGRRPGVRWEPHLAGTLVGAHLETDGRVVHGGQDVVLGVVQMPSCAVGRHARLAGALVGAHLQGGRQER